MAEDDEGVTQTNERIVDGKKRVKLLPMKIGVCRITDRSQSQADATSKRDSVT